MVETVERACKSSKGTPGEIIRICFVAFIAADVQSGQRGDAARVRTFVLRPAQASMRLNSAEGWGWLRMSVSTGGTRRRLLAGTALGAVLLLPSLAQAQTWTGGTDYNTPGNWNPANVPDSAGETATFAGTGTASVVVSAPVSPQAWTFAANAQSYGITGAAVTFSTGITNNASAGQVISIANNMTGSTLSQAAASTLTLGGTNSFTTGSITGGTLVNNGSLTATTVTNAGGAFNNNSTVTGRVNTSAGITTNAGLIDGRVGITGGSVFFTGNGSLTKDVLFSGSASSAILDISNTNSGATIASVWTLGTVAGTINLGSKTLTIAGNIVTSLDFRGIVQGSGGITVGTGGLLGLNGTSTYTGATTIQGDGYLRLDSPNAIAASSVVNIASAGASLEANDSNIRTLQGVAGSNVYLFGTLTLTAASTAFAGAINDSNYLGYNGNVTLLAGHQTFDGINLYFGATNVNGGTLTVNGSIAPSSMTTVNAGATLDGSGTVGNTTINGGTLSPGNGGVGTMTVQGSLFFTAASTYLVQVSPTAASRANVSGAATLGGATVRTSYAAGSYVARQYTILNATGGLVGTFGALVSGNMPPSLKQSLSYDSANTTVYLNTELAFTVPGGLTGNQAAVGNALTRYFNTNGGIPFVFAQMSPGALSQSAGETGTGSQQSTFNAMNQFMGVMTDPFVAGRGDQSAPSGSASGYAEEPELGYAPKNPNNALAAIYSKARPVVPFEARWSTWVAGYGGSQTTDGNAAVGSNSATSRIYGTAVGADYRFSPFTIAGFSLAGGGTNFSVANNGSGRSDLFQAGAFMRHDVGAAYITGALAYGWQDITTDRTVAIAGIDRLRANFRANAWSGRVEGGYRFVAPVAGGIGLTPYAAGQFTTFELPNYAETVVSGANTFALGYAAKSVTASRSELGLRTDKSFAMSDGVFTLRGRVAWAHDYNNDRSLGATFQTLPGASFVVNGASQAPDAALVTASAEKKWVNGWSAAGTFEGEFSNVTASYAGKGAVRYAW
jgi:uncharacterized protein with beta-barrel porin domain